MEIWAIKRIKIRIKMMRIKWTIMRKIIKKKKRIRRVHWDYLRVFYRDIFHLNGVWHNFEYRMFGQLSHLEVMKQRLWLYRVTVLFTKQHLIQRMAVIVKRSKRNRF